MLVCLPVCLYQQSTTSFSTPEDFFLSCSCALGIPEWAAGKLFLVKSGCPAPGTPWGKHQRLVTLCDTQLLD